MLCDDRALTLSKRIALGLIPRILETILLSVRQCCLKLPQRSALTGIESDSGQTTLLSVHFVPFCLVWHPSVHHEHRVPIQLPKKAKILLSSIYNVFIMLKYHTTGLSATATCENCWHQGRPIHMETKKEGASRSHLRDYFLPNLTGCLCDTTCWSSVVSVSCCSKMKGSVHMEV